MRRLAAGLTAGLLAATSGWRAAASDLQPMRELAYELPPAGSYELPVIDRVSDHSLLGIDGKPAPLLALGPDQVALVAFIYRSCVDATGCPLALASLQRVDRVLAGRPDLRDRVRLVTVSFDPERDTPQTMAMLRHHMSPQADWRFLTAPNGQALRPLLEDFGQDAVPLLTADGARSGLLRHVVKVFLVDGQGGVRNIYSTGFLDHRLLIRDVETLFAD